MKSAVGERLWRRKRGRPLGIWRRIVAEEER
jgi:hypothetical protein